MITLDPARVRAAIFDMDGVITNTAVMHSRAWRRMLDDYLALRGSRGDSSGEPYSDADYTHYIDGKLRYDGVRSFLASRGIRLGEGQPSDPPGRETVCGLGNLKDELFHRLLLESGVEVYQDALDLLGQLRRAGVRAAVISSSRNCRDVLASGDLDQAFDVLVDGVESDRLKLAGKPHPDIFLEAARRLGVAPAEAAIFEDAVAGVQAGRQGGFALVVGVARKGNAEELVREGAHAAVPDLAAVKVSAPPAREGAVEAPPPALAERMGEFHGRIAGRHVALFLDYDGTLTPIVAQPEMARLSESMRQTVSHLARHCRVAVVSGRDLADVRDLVGLEHVYYAGSHGFDIAGPGGFRMELEAARGFLCDLDDAAERLRRELAEIPGARIERKHFAIAVHYRNVSQEDMPELMESFTEVAAAHPRLRRRGGKKIFELQPDIEWDKGRAVAFLLEALGLSGPEVLPVYVGDDLTDEDAFRSLRGRGVGLYVGPAGSPSAADYRLDDVPAVERFIQHLGARLAQPAQVGAEGRR